MIVVFTPRVIPFFRGIEHGSWRIIWKNKVRIISEVGEILWAIFFGNKWFADYLAEQVKLSLQTREIFSQFSILNEQTKNSNKKLKTPITRWPFIFIFIIKFNYFSPYEAIRYATPQTQIRNIMYQPPVTRPVTATSQNNQSQILQRSLQQPHHSHTKSVTQKPIPQSKRQQPTRRRKANTSIVDIDSTSDED